MHSNQILQSPTRNFQNLSLLRQRRSSSKLWLRLWPLPPGLPRSWREWTHRIYECKSNGVLAISGVATFKFSLSAI
ncbi:hypothetical protein CPB86DRAFT_49887 [Serendipita vermifera]|nr:hypothetical protein CPB86DRAFT_49887 [Serendipita vermifera]